MKKLIRCKNCRFRARYLPVGFNSEPTDICTFFSNGSDILVVALDDGCTFGSKGESGKALKLYDVIIGDDAAKYGWNEYF